RRGADTNRRYDVQRFRIDHGNVVRWAVSGIEKLAVARKADAPRTLSDADVRKNVVRLEIDDRDGPRAAIRDVKALPVRGKREPHRQRAGRQRDRVDDLVARDVDDRHAPAVLGRYVRASPIRAEHRVPRTTPNRDAAPHLAARRVDHGDRVLALARDVQGAAVRAEAYALRLGPDRDGADHVAALDIDGRQEAGVLVRDEEARFELIDIELFRVRSAGQHA